MKIPPPNSVDNSVENHVFSPETLLDWLVSHKIPHQLHHHRAVFTVGEANDIDAAIPGMHTRNLFVRDKREKMFLVTLEAARKIDLGKLATLMGAGRLSFGSPGRLMKYLGVTPGSVTPFAILNDVSRQVELILDAEMLRSEIVNFHPLINTMTVGLAPASLINLLEAAGITPRIMDLTPAGS